MLRVASISAATLICCGLAAPISQAKIVKNESIRGIAIGDTKSSVRKRLGNPDENVCQAKVDRKCAPRFWGYGENFGINFVDGKVSSLFTSSHKQRTSDGIGPGVTRSKVEEHYPKCNKPANGSCFLNGRPYKDPEVGQRYTFVDFDGDRVAWVVVGKYDPKYNHCALGCG